MTNALTYAQARHRDLPVYRPGKPVEATAREYGLKAEDICKLASNENPLGPSPMGREAAQRELLKVHRYPDGSCTNLRQKLALRLSLEEGQLVFGNGSNDVIELFAHAFINSGDEAIMGAEAFPVYRIVTLLLGGKPVEVSMPDHRHDLDAILAAVNSRTRAVFLPGIDNPTGTANTRDEVSRFVEQLPEHVALLFDEAYHEFHDEAPDLSSYIKAGRPVLVTRTFSKIYGLAGLRVGYGFGCQEMADILNAIRQPFNVNSVAQAAATAALDDDAFVSQSLQVINAGREQLESGFKKLDLAYVNSLGNFVLLKIPEPLSAFEYLQKRGYIVRPIPSSPGYIRVSVGLEKENTGFIQALESYLRQQ